MTGAAQGLMLPCRLLQVSPRARPKGGLRRRPDRQACTAEAPAHARRAGKQAAGCTGLMGISCT